MRRILILMPLLLFGCGVNPGKNPDPVQIEGTVTVNGKNAGDVVLNLQPTGNGTQAIIPVKKGAVRGVVTPGKYTYYLSQASNPKAFAAVPEAYRAGSLERQIEISKAGNVDFDFKK